MAAQIYAERYRMPLVVRIASDGEYHFEPTPGLYDERHRGPCGGTIEPRGSGSE